GPALGGMIGNKGKKLIRPLARGCVSAIDRTKAWTEDAIEGRLVSDGNPERKTRPTEAESLDGAEDVCGGGGLPVHHLQRVHDPYRAGGRRSSGGLRSARLQYYRSAHPGQGDPDRRHPAPPPALPSQTVDPFLPV